MSLHASIDSIQRTIEDYFVRIRLFKPNARLYLIFIILSGLAMGVYRLIFNFFILSLGYDEALLGSLVTASSLTALLVALPMGYLADRLGRKNSLLLSGFVTAVAFLAMVIWPGEAMLYAMNVLSGAAQSLSGVTMSPFLMENSSEKERTYLFSMSLGLQMTMVSVGNWIGGYLPGWIGHIRSVAPTSSIAYGGTMWVVGLSYGIGLLPLLMLQMPPTTRQEQTVFTPISYARHHPALLGKMISPLFLTAIGAGLVMPFINIFYRLVYHQSDPVIGALFAWGSLAMGAGLLIAPPLADRMGKVPLVVVTQGLSIPFLVLMGFAPQFWVSASAYYIRLALMNMSTPVYETFVMEHVEASARATVASLVSMSWNFGWAFSPMISGWLQVRYGFAPAFFGTICLYSVSVFLYWSFFWRGEKAYQALPVTGT